MKKILTITLILATLTTFASCTKTTVTNENAIETNYLGEEIGDSTEGERSFNVVEQEFRTDTFDFTSSATTLKDALLAENFIAGDETSNGFFITTVNGIDADYELEKTYWAIWVNNQPSTVGIDQIEFHEGDI